MKAIFVEAALLVRAWGFSSRYTDAGHPTKTQYPLVSAELGCEQQLKVLERLLIAVNIFRGFLESTQKVGSKNEFDPEGVDKGILNIWDRMRFLDENEDRIREYRNRRYIEVNRKRKSLIESQIELDEEHQRLQFKIDEERKLIKDCCLGIFARRKALETTP